MTRSLVITLSLLVLALSATRDCSQSGCFVKQLFDFNYPKEGIYNISMGIAFIIKAIVQAKWIVSSRPMGISITISGQIMSLLIAMAILLSSFTTLLQATTNKLPTAYPLLKTAYPQITTYVSHIAFRRCQWRWQPWYHSVGHQSNRKLHVPHAPKWRLLPSRSQHSQLHHHHPASSFRVRSASRRRIHLDQLFAAIQSKSRSQPQEDLLLQQWQLVTHFLGSVNQPWGSMFTGGDYSAVAFSNQHWNTFIDLTNDCYPDFVLTNDQNSLEFWIYNSQTKTYIFSTFHLM